MGAFEGEQLVVKEVGRADFLALGALVHRVYMLHSRKAMEQHGWRCARCRSSRAAGDPPSQVPVARRNASRREPGAGLPGLPQADPSDRAVAQSIMNPRTLVRDLAGAITAKDYFARDESGTLYVYRGGVYRPDGELLVRQRVKHLLLDQDCSEMWSRALSNEILEFISLDVPELPERPSTELINLENGLLNVRTRQLFPHSPEFLSTIRIPIAFDQGGGPALRLRSSLAKSSLRMRFRSLGRSSAIF